MFVVYSVGWVSLLLRSSANENAIAKASGTWTERGEAHRELAFSIAHEALKKAKLNPARTFKEADLADRMARRSAGLDNAENVQQALLIHISESLDEFPVEAEVIDSVSRPPQGVEHTL